MGGGWEGVGRLGSLGRWVESPPPIGMRAARPGRAGPGPVSRALGRASHVALTGVRPNWRYSDSDMTRI